MSDDQVNVGVDIHGDAGSFIRAVDEARNRLRALADSTREQSSREQEFGRRTSLTTQALEQNSRALAEQLRQQAATRKTTTSLSDALGDQAKKLSEAMAAGSGYRKVLDENARTAAVNAGATRKLTDEIKDQAASARVAESSNKGYARSSAEAAVAATTMGRAASDMAFDVAKAAHEQSELAERSKAVTERLAVEAIEAHQAGRALDEKGRKSLESALAQKVLQGEARETAEQLVKEERAAYRAALGLEAVKHASFDVGDGFAAMRRDLVALGIGGAVAAIAPLTAGVFDLGGAAVVAAAALVPFAGALTAVGTAAGGMVQILGVLKLSQLSDVFKSLSENGDKLKQTLNGLAPPAREFALTLRDVLGPLDDIQAKIQEGLFPGLTKGLKEAEPAIRTVEDILVTTAKAIGQVANEAGRLLGSKEFNRNLAKFGDINARGIESLGTALLTMADAFLKVEVIATPLIKFLEDGMVRASRAVDDYVGHHAKGLGEFFKTTKEAISSTLGILLNLGRIFSGVFDAALPTVRLFGDALKTVTGHWATVVNSPQGQSALRNFFAGMIPALSAMAKAVGELGIDLAKLAVIGQSGIVRLFDDIRTRVLPLLLKLIQDFTARVLPSLLGALEAILKWAKDMEPGLRPLLNLVGTLLNLLKGLVDWLDKLTRGLPGILKLLPLIGAGLAALGSVKLIGAAWSALGDLFRARVLAPIQDAVKARAALAVAGARDAAGQFIRDERGGAIVIGGGGGEKKGGATGQEALLTGGGEAAAGKGIEKTVFARGEERSITRFITPLRATVAAAIVAGVIGGLGEAANPKNLHGFGNKLHDFIAGALNVPGSLLGISLPTSGSESAKLTRKLAGQIQGNAGPFAPGVIRGGGLVSDLGVKNAKEYLRALDLTAAQRRALNRLIDQEHTKLARQLALQKEINREMANANSTGPHAADNVDRQLDGLKKARQQIRGFVDEYTTKFKNARTINHTTLRDMVQDLQSLPKSSRETAALALVQMAETLRKNGKLPERAVRELRRALRAQGFNPIASDAANAGSAAASNFASNFATVKGAVHGILGGIQGALSTALKTLGQSHILDFGLKALDKSGTLSGIAGGVKSALGALTIPHLSATPPAAAGGFIGANNGGRPAPDNIPVLAAEGEVILNRHQQGYINAVMAAAGDGGGIPGVVSGIRRPHYAAGGGYSIHGKMSTFGPPGEAAGSTSSGVSSALPGIALYDGGLRNNHLFRVSQDHTGRSAVLKKTDVGPAPWTGRVIDVTGAGVKKMGISNIDSITDTLGTAIDLGFSGANDPGAPGNMSLPNLRVTGPGGGLRSMLQGIANKSISAANGYLAKFASALSAGPGEVFGKDQLSMYAFPLPDFGSEQRVDRGQDMESAHPHAPFTAFGDAIVTSGATDFPGVMYKLTKGPFKGREVFDGHTFSSSVAAGQPVTAGQALGKVGHTGASYDGDASHIEIGFYQPTGGGSFGYGEHTQGGIDMHNALHAIAPGRIGARIINGATGGYPSLGGMMTAASGAVAHTAAAKHYHPPHRKVKQHAGKKHTTKPQFGAHFLSALAGTEVPPQLTHIELLANRLSGLDNAYNSMVDSTGRTEEQPMVSLSDADAAYFQLHPGELPGVAPNLIAALQSGDQVPNFYGLTVGRYYGFNATGGAPTIQGGTFTRGVAQRLAEIGGLEGNRKGWLKIGNSRYSSISHLIHRLNDKRHGLILKARRRLKSIRRRAEANLRHVMFLLGEQRKLKGKRIDQQIASVLSRGSINRRRHALHEQINGLQGNIAEEQDYQQSLPADQRDTSHIDSMQDQVRGLRANLSDEDTFARTQSNRLGALHLAKTAFNIGNSLKKYEHEQRRLTGTGADILTLGTGGLYGKVNSRLSSFQSTLTGELNDRAQAATDISGVKSDIAGFEDERKQYSNLFPIMPRDIATATSPTGSDTSDLKNQLLQNALTDLAVSQGQYGVFQGFSGLLKQRLVGQFEHGTMRVPETGMALVHRGEHISPDPEGPYGSQIVAGRQAQAAAPVIQLTFNGNADQLVSLIDARVDGRAAKVVSRQLGARARQIRSVS